MSQDLSIRHTSQMSEATFSKELLVTYASANGEEQCAIVRVEDTYEEMLAEACLNLAPWLPSDWQDRRRDFAREVRNARGDTIWAAIQPSLVEELAKLGRLPELRLRIHPSSGQGSQPPRNNSRIPDEQSPAYEANPRQSAVDGIVQAVLHRLYNEDPGYTPVSTPGPGLSSSAPAVQDMKSRLQEPEDPLHLESQTPQSPSTSTSSNDNPIAASNIARPPNILPPSTPNLAQQPENNQLPTPQSPPSRPTPWNDGLIRQTQPPPRIQPIGLPPPPVLHLDKSKRSIERTLQSSSKLISEGKHEAAIRLLRSTCNNPISPQERAQFFLWLGQVGCEIMEYTNANCDTAIARDIFLALENRSGRIACDIVLARIAREKTGVSLGEDAKLAQLLAEAKRHGLEAIEVQLLCEICRLGCSGKDMREDLVASVEQAKAVAHKLGDTWLKAESSGTAAMVSEAGGDYISALQAYSSALELYRSAKAPLPLSPIKEIEAGMQRMRVALSKAPEKPKSGFRKFF